MSLFTHRFVLLGLVSCALCFRAAPLRAADTESRAIGVARIDVTPAEPIRLTGYGSRRTNSIGIEQKLWAKALALDSDADGPALLLTLDNCGIAEPTYVELIQRLAKTARLKQDRIAIACSHTHSGPCTTSWAPNIFSQDIPAEQQAAIDRYTRDLLDKLEQVALAALKDRRPGTLSWSQGRVNFARNRRVTTGSAVQFGDNAAGPADHALPVLLVTDPDGNIRALVANYACHCTTLGGEFNKLHGDWAGCAQETLERDHPGAIALITIGCGADANPSPRGTLGLAQQHGEELAAEVKRLLTQTFTPLPARLSTGLKHIELPFGPHFTREQWEERAKKAGIVGYHAQKFLARLDRGEKLPDNLSYYVQTWQFGDDLALVFLSGEVVVDYALRLKQDFDATRLWVTAYANYVPCYIPSRRILSEGGYEAEDSLWYYDRPDRISTNAEDLIIRTVHELMPKSYLFDRKKADFPDPKTPQQALATFRTKRDFVVELVASEPLIESPVAIDWGADGRLWVCEMYDYPAGISSGERGQPGSLSPGERAGVRGDSASIASSAMYQPGGRIKILSSTKHDGHYDKATLFLDGLAFPTGVMPWRKGALICAAPDILYAEDTDGDGRADLVRTNFTGFATHNFQARVNGFTWGLDGWLHGSSGLFGGKVKSLLTGLEVDLSGRDFRLKPDTGEIEPVAGLSQMGRVRDDFDNWFGNDNSTLLWHYPLPDHSLRRNPHVTYPDPRVNVAAGPRMSPSAAASSGKARAAGEDIRAAVDPNQLFPISRTLERFNDPAAANRVTSACGPCLYRDDLLGPDYYGNAFICEPVHNLVTRRILEPDGTTFSARRADDEQRGEFLASTDSWFRPVQVRTGPDGALWVVDMYRFVIEHPRWIPPDRLKQLDVRAGADRGRIYRVVPKSEKPRPIQNLANLQPEDLASAMKSRNGLVRDLAHRELVHWRQDYIRAEPDRARATPPTVTAMPLLDPSPGPRAHGLIVLDALDAMTVPALELGMVDTDPRVRRVAVGIVERRSAVSPQLLKSLLPLERDPDPSVRLRVALALGQWTDPRASAALGRLAQDGDRWLRAAVLSSAAAHVEGLLKATRDWPASTPGRAEFMGQLCRVTVGHGDPARVRSAVEAIAPGDVSDTGWFEPLATLLDAASARTMDLEALFAESAAGRQAREAMGAARQLVTDNSSSETVQERSVRLLARRTGDVATDVPLLCRLLTTTPSARVQSATLERLRDVRGGQVAQHLLEQWPHLPPALRARTIPLLLTREEWTRALVAALNNGTVAATEISAADRQRLAKHSDNEIRALAAKLFQRDGSRDAVLARFQGVASLAPSPEHGAQVFDKSCAQCHAYRDHGHAVGPNLAEFADKSVADFVQAIFDPNSAINPNFLAYNIDTKDGRSLTGIVRGETAGGLTLVQGGGVQENILRSDFQDIRASQISLMPEGLEQGMTPQDVADLIAWVKNSGYFRVDSPLPSSK